MPFAPRFSTTTAITAALTRIESARAFLDAAKLPEDWVQSLSEVAIGREAHHTTHMEGSKLALEQAEHLLAGHLVPGADPDDVRGLLNYRVAFALVSSHLAQGGPITEALVCGIHERLFSGVRGVSAAPGKYRTNRNEALDAAGRPVRTSPPAHDVPVRMRELVAWLNEPGDVHPVLASGIAQAQLAYIRPFVDGNGRTSRLVSILCLYRAGYDDKRFLTPSEFYDRDLAAYDRALQGVRESGMDLTRWLEYFTAGLVADLEELVPVIRDEYLSTLRARETGMQE